LKAAQQKVEILLSSNGGPQLAPFSAPDEDLSESSPE
jgi:exonuclease VII small subunit